ncbi:HU family DNA-binding protein [Chromobacterium haemolyticum]|uniref:HU family DNA-binding protein n=1 Tax=Chromobacterium haemolyticum TaxID=394935 RepID=UPI00244A077D|nr:HU family DNA-binding protein [Chromobacterium haemolyticum]MDH0342096.1 HU family DNA-binding protein [Chromobacterium haemolyticum]
MSKSAIASLVAEKHGLTKAESEEIVSTVIDGIKSTLVSQGSISFVKFGRFLVDVRPARVGRNPHTGDKVAVPAQRVVKFVAWDSLKKALNPEK